MPLRSLRWIRPSAGASWAGADGATAAVAVAAAVVLMNARRFISYGAVMTLPWSWTIPVLVPLTQASWTGTSRQSPPPFARGFGDQGKRPWDEPLPECAGWRSGGSARISGSGTGVFRISPRKGIFQTLPGRVCRCGRRFAAVAHCETDRDLTRIIPALG